MLALFSHKASSSGTISLLAASIARLCLAEDTFAYISVVCTLECPSRSRIKSESLNFIRDILGHVSVQTTEIYARADSKLKREAIEKAYVDVAPKEEPFWENNQNLLSWLKSF